MAILDALDKIPKDSILSALVYIYQYYVFDSYELMQDLDRVRADLQKMGYKKPVIDRSLGWIKALDEQKRFMTYPFQLQTAGYRIFSALEEKRLDVAARNYLMMLRNDLLITAHEFELIAHQAILLDEPTITQSLLQWVVMIILFDDSEREDALEKVQSMVLNEKRRSKDLKKEVA